jgi:hypothetical protein
LLEQESEPYTAHVEQFRDYKARFLRYYRDAFIPDNGFTKLRKMAESAGENVIKTALGSLAQGGLPISELGDMARVHSVTEPNQNAIEIMASTRAHYHSG